MNKNLFLGGFREIVWNKKQLDKIVKYAFKVNTIHLDPANPWEEKVWSHSAFVYRME